MNIKKLFLLTNIFLAITCIITFLPLKTTNVKAAEIQNITAKVDYDNETIAFNNIRSKKVFFAPIKKNGYTSLYKIKNWDYVKASNATIDISTYIGTKETYLSYKDGVNGGIKVVAIQAAPKVVLDKGNSSAIVGQFVLKEKIKDRISLITRCAIQVKKGKKGRWMDWSYNKPVSASELGYKDVFERWQKSGATIYVRAAADINRYPASNEVLVKIKKLANGPKLILDPIKTIAKMKRHTEYKVYPPNYVGDPDSDLNWIMVEDSEAKSGISIETLAAKANTVTSSALIIEYRKAKTDKKPASKITTVAVSGQAIGPTVGSKNDINAEIQIYTANLGTEKKVVTGTAIRANRNGYEYEYKIGTNDLTKGWKSLKGNKLFKLKSTQAKENDIILIRRKGIKANKKKNINFQWASAYTSYIIRLY